MPFTIQWLVPERVLLSTFEGVMTLAEIEQVVQAFISRMDTTVPPVHVMLCTNDVTRPVTDLNALYHITKPYFRHPRLGWTVLQSDNKLHHFLVGTLAKLLGARWTVAADVAAAEVFLREQDATLPPLEHWMLYGLMKESAQGS